jgi:hypothetical protein
MHDHKKDPVLEALEDCRTRLEALKLDEQLTQQAGPAFAELGERVDAVLEERRSLGDRRASARPGGQRRET